MKETEDTDKALLLSLQKGNEMAFDSLFRKYYTTLCAYAHRFVRMDVAENLVQDMMTWLWENRETFVIESSLSSYLFRSIYHRALNHINREETAQRAEAKFYIYLHEHLSDLENYRIEELTRKIDESINKLPESYREAFIMHRFRQMSYKEIAHELGVSPQTINYRIVQALKLLRIDLQDYLPLLVGVLFT